MLLNASSVSAQVEALAGEILPRVVAAGGFDVPRPLVDRDAPLPPCAGVDQEAYS